SPRIDARGGPRWPGDVLRPLTGGLPERRFGEDRRDRIQALGGLEEKDRFGVCEEDLVAIQLAHLLRVERRALLETPTHGLVGNSSLPAASGDTPSRQTTPYVRFTI